MPEALPVKPTPPEGGWASPAWADRPWGWRDRAWLLGAALAWAAWVAATWGRWAWPTADSARELLIPFQLAQGLPLYREVSYLYGPLAPAFQALLLKAIAPRVEVLMAFNALLAFWSQAATYLLARRALGLGPSALAMTLVATHCMLGPDILGHLWPYAHAATFGLALGLGCLNALLAHAAGGSRAWLILAGALGGLAVATKLEFGFGAALALLAYGLWRAWGHAQSARAGQAWGGALGAWAAEAGAALLPGLLAFVGLAAWALGHASWPEVQAEVWPTRLMALWGSQGAWKGDAVLWAANAKWLLLVGGLGGALAGLGWWRRWPWAWGVWALGLALGAWALSRGIGAFYVAEFARMWYGPTFAVLFGALAWALWRGPAAGVAGALWCVVGAYGLGVASRTLFVGLNAYSPYQAPVAFLAWVALFALAWPWLWRRLLGDAWAGSLSGASQSRPGQVALAGAGLALAGLNLWPVAQAYAAPHQAVAGRVGVLVPPQGMAEAFDHGLAHLRGAMAPGEGLLALPMDGVVYSFLGKPNPLVQANLYLGYLTTPGEEAAAIARLGSRNVRWVWVSNYGQFRLGVDYLPGLMAFVRGNGQVAARFGGPGRAYAVTLWRLKAPADWQLPPSLGGGKAWAPPEEHHDD